MFKSWECSLSGHVPLLSPQAWTQHLGWKAQTTDSFTASPLTLTLSSPEHGTAEPFPTFHLLPDPGVTPFLHGLHPCPPRLLGMLKTPKFVFTVWFWSRTFCLVKSCVSVADLRPHFLFSNWFTPQTPQHSFAGLWIPVASVLCISYPHYRDSVTVQRYYISLVLLYQSIYPLQRSYPVDRKSS